MKYLRVPRYTYLNSPHCPRAHSAGLALLASRTVHIDGSVPYLGSTLLNISKKTVILICGMPVYGQVRGLYPGVANQWKPTNSEHVT